MRNEFRLPSNFRRVYDKNNNHDNDNDFDGGDDQVDFLNLLIVN